jgi:hypothetical protein
MPSAIEKAEGCALRERMLRVVTPIMENADGDGPAIGCGTLFQRGERRFLVTALHVIETLPSGNIAVALGERYSPLVTPGQGTLAWVRSHDVAVLELNDASFLRQLQDVDYRPFLTDSDVLATGSASSYVLYGYPAVDTKLKGESYWSEPLLLECSAYSGTPTKLKRARTSEDTFLEWTASQGKDLEGISGTPVWSREDGAGDGELWSTGLKICGVETSVLQDTWIRCTQWSVINAILAKQFGV